MPITLYVPATWYIAVFSLSERDDQIVKTYLTPIKNTQGRQEDIEIPNSAFPKAEITVRTVAVNASQEQG